MQSTIKKRLGKISDLLFLMTGLFCGGILMLSFSYRITADEFWKRLGMSKDAAEQKITGSILGGYVNSQGVSNLRQLMNADKKALVTDLLNYTKKYTATPAFIAQYHELREKNKPAFTGLKTPEAFRKENIESWQEQVKKLETSVKNADTVLRPVFRQSLEEARKQLKEAENPESRIYMNYRLQYEESATALQAGNAEALQQWAEKYPENHRIFLKHRLTQFLQETENIDFSAKTILKNGKKVFVLPEHEKQSRNWKMAWRSGREVVETARAFVQQWLKELN